MTTSDGAVAWPGDDEAFDEYGSGVMPVAPSIPAPAIPKPPETEPHLYRPTQYDRTPQSLGCYSSVAHIYETARADERTVLTRKFARWMQLYSVRNRPHTKNAIAVARGEWLTELEEADREVE